MMYFIVGLIITAFILLAAFISAGIIYLVWNLVLHPIFNAPLISLLQAFLIDVALWLVASMFKNKDK